MTLVIYAVAASIVKVACWAIPAIAAAVWLAYWLDDDASGFDRHAQSAIDLTRPSIGDEADAYLRGRWVE